MPSTSNLSQTKLTTLVKPRVEHFTHSEIHALVRSLGEWVSVYANGKKDEVSLAANKLLEEFSAVKVVPHPQS